MPLIEADELAGCVQDERCVLLDCRFDLSDPKAGLRAFRQGHIPGARYADLEQDLSAVPSSEQGRHPLPEPATFAKTLGRWGIDNATRVVAYDARHSAYAARAWWMLRWLGHEDVHVLNGGLEAWVDAGLPVDAQDEAPREKIFTPTSVQADWILTTGEIPDFLEHGTLLDARSPARFYGEVEPIDPIAGHVPGAVNYFFEQSLGERARFLPRAQLLAKLGQFVRDERPLGVMCGSGVTACHVLLALEVAGLGGAKLYAGSWSEWIRDAGRPVATRDGT